MNGGRSALIVASYDYADPELRRLRAPPPHPQAARPVLTGSPVRDVEEHFGGRGRAVITATSAVEYAFEGDHLADTRELNPSVFTSALVQGLETGDADRDQDGHVGLDELYDYVYGRVREVTPNQTPGKWMFGVEGELHIARRGRPVTQPAPLPAELQEVVDHPLPGVR